MHSLQMYPFHISLSICIPLNMYPLKMYPFTCTTLFVDNLIPSVPVYPTRYPLLALTSTLLSPSNLTLIIPPPPPTPNPIPHPQL